MAVKHGPVEYWDIWMDMGKVKIEVMNRGSFVRHQFRGDTDPMPCPNRDGRQIELLIFVFDGGFLPSEGCLVSKVRR